MLTVTLLVASALSLGPPEMSRGKYLKLAAGGAAVAAASSRPARRAIRFEVGMARILSRYVVCYAGAKLLRHEPDWPHETTGAEVEALVRNMRGAYVKTAQLVSTAFPESLPDAWVRQLERMVDDAPARPWTETAKILKKELGSLDCFDSIDSEPIAAASVGQVHRASYKGKDVAVKVMFPGARSLILTDLANIRRVLRVVKPALLPAVDEFRARVGGEFDYQDEAHRMMRVRNYIATRRDLRRRVVVPEPVLGLTTKRVLVMDWLEGGSLRETIRREATRALETRSPIVRGLRISKLRRKAKRCLNVVARAHAAMIFGDGAFTADPHPGNVLLINKGRQLGIIDYGNFKTFTDSELALVADLYVALRGRNRARIVDTMARMGFQSKNMDPTFIVAFATQCFDTDIVTASPYQLLVDLEERDTLVTIPMGYMLVCRVALLIRGLSRKLGFHMSCADIWRAEARQCQRRLAHVERDDALKRRRRRLKKDDLVDLAATT